MASVPDAVVAVKRAEWGRIVAGLIRVTGDWALAEDCAQDAFAAALARWPRDGLPEKPAAWVATTARNRAIDLLRRSASESSKLRELAMMNEEAAAPRDDRLQLIFTCCHPALPLAARVALTLRTVAGLTTPEIAAAFLVPEATMAQRLVRARRKIAAAGIPYRVPPPELLGERLRGVLAVLYLLFNEGYTALERNELAESAIALVGAVVELMPGESEARGLLALMLLHNSRRDARVDADGIPLTLEQQDRSLWRRDDVERALRVLRSAEGRGSYVLQAEIAAVHARAVSPEDTRWVRIVELYERLLALEPSPVVELNRAIAVGMARGPDAGLALLEQLDASGALERYYLLPAACADLLRRAGRFAEAAGQYERAIQLASAASDRAFLERRLAEIGA